MHSTNLFIPTKATEHEMHPAPLWQYMSETTVFMELIRKPPNSAWEQEGEQNKEWREKQCQPLVKKKQRKSAVH